MKIALLKLESKRIEDIPFNFGSDFVSQKIIESIKQQPTGWGGIYSQILKSVPKLQVNKPIIKDEL